MNETIPETLLKSSRKRRIVAYLIDHVIISFLIVSTIFGFLGADFFEKSDASKFVPTILFGMLFGFFLYFSKDATKGISPGKWVMGIMVRDQNDYNSTPSFRRLFLRNITLVIWPVEFIVLATSDKKLRLGDNLAKTVVLQNPNKPSKTPRIIALVVIGIGFITFMLTFASNALKNSFAYKTAVENIEQSDNIKNKTGGIIGYGMIPSGTIQTRNGYGKANLNITVKGKKKDVEVQAYLEKKPDSEWILVEMNP